MYATKGNRGRNELVLNEGDWVWLHLRKDKFPTKRKSKLSPRGWTFCRQRIKLKVLMMPKDYMNHMLLKDLLKTKQLELIKMDDQDSL